LKNAVVAFFNLAKLAAKLLTARKITTYVVILDRIHATTQPAEFFNRLLNAFAWADRNVRFYRLHHFPYLLPYQALPEAVVVVGLRHSATDLSAWASRLDE
jgi:hypothetical protein